MTTHRFELFADYFQVYLMDESSDDDTSEIWTDRAFELKLGIAKNTLAIGTYRNVDVPFEIEIFSEEPNIDLSKWDHASQGYFSVASGKCAVFGCTDYRPDAATISIPNGDYAVLSLAKGLASITEEWEPADDLYKVLLWPSSNKQHESLKQYENT